MSDVHVRVRPRDKGERVNKIRFQYIFCAGGTSSLRWTLATKEDAAVACVCTLAQYHISN